jgi:hypothetical protein
MIRRRSDRLYCPPKNFIFPVFPVGSHLGGCLATPTDLFDAGGLFLFVSACRHALDWLRTPSFIRHE